MKSIIAVALVGALGALASGCSQQEKWLGFYYPDKNDLTVDQPLGEFATLETCRDVAASRPGVSTGSADYECALNCNGRVGADGPLICEKTER